MTLRQAIDAHCRGCIYDNLAAGTWRQQTTLCSVTSCPLWPHRPRTKSEIPESVLRYYGAEMDASRDSKADAGTKPGQQINLHEDTKTILSRAVQEDIGEVAG